MEKETLNLLIGGGIGFFASIMITIVTFIFHCIENNKKRKWEVEDRQYISGKNVTNMRLNQIEEYATNIKKLADKISIELSILKKDRAYLKSFLGDFPKEMLGIWYVTLLPEILEDKKLTESAGELFKSFTDITRWILEVSEAGEFDQETYSSIHIKTNENYVNLLKNIDRYRIEYFGPEKKSK